MSRPRFDARVLIVMVSLGINAILWMKFRNSGGSLPNEEFSIVGTGLGAIMMLEKRS